MRRYVFRLNAVDDNTRQPRAATNEAGKRVRKFDCFPSVVHLYIFRVVCNPALVLLTLMFSRAQSVWISRSPLKGKGGCVPVDPRAEFVQSSEGVSCRFPSCAISNFLRACDACVCVCAGS